MINLICFSVAMIGGINWLSIGIIQFDFVAAIFGSQAHVVSRIIYVLVGISCIYLIYQAIAKRGTLEFGKKKYKAEKNQIQQDMLG